MENVPPQTVPAQRHVPRHASCLAAALTRIPQHAQWRARQDVLAATPANIGKPERAARQAMPSDLYERSDAGRSK
jgi:hypothetical protein